MKFASLDEANETVSPTLTAESPKAFPMAPGSLKQGFELGCARSNPQFVDAGRGRGPSRRVKLKVGEKAAT